MAQFKKLDEEAATKPSKVVPLRLSGLSGEMATELFTDLSSKQFAKVLSDLQGILDAIGAGGNVVERFFGYNNYTPEECVEVVKILLEDDIMSIKFKDIDEASVLRVIVAHEENIPSLQNTRKAVKAAKIGKEAQAFLERLATTSRLDLLSKVVGKMQALQAALDNQIDITVVSAVPLSKGQADSVKKVLPQYVEAGQKSNVAFEVDPAVLGGLMVKVGQSAIDLTVQSQLVNQMGNKA